MSPSLRIDGAPTTASDLAPDSAIVDTLRRNRRNFRWRGTPDEVHFGRPPACLAPRFETRQRWPRHASCAAPQAPARGRPGARLELCLHFAASRKHLPIVALKRVA